MPLIDVNHLVVLYGRGNDASEASAPQRCVASPGPGLGADLLDAILQAATARSFRRFRAYVLADDRRMLDLISRFSRIEARKTERGVTELVFRLDPARALAAT